MMYRRPAVVRRGPGLLGAVAVGGMAYAAGRATAGQAAQERRQDAQIADLQQQQARPAPALSSEDRIGQLQELGELKASGVLTDEEFLREKRRVLGAG